MGSRKLILSESEFKEYKDVPDSERDNKQLMCIKDAQVIDLFKALGGFLFKIEKNITEQSYQDLLEGCYFTYNGEDYYQEGIKSLLADYAYTRYLYKANIHLTAFGAKTKQYEDSTTVSGATLRDIAKQGQDDTAVKFELIEMYIKEKFPSDYIRTNEEGIGTHTSNVWVAGEED